MIERTARTLTALSMFGWCVLLVVPSLAQEADDVDPLKGTRKLGDASEILLLWSEHYANPTRNASFLDYINLNNPDPDVPNDLVPMELQSVSSAERSESGYPIDVISGDFDGDNLDDYVAAWEGPNRSIEMIIPDLDRTNLEWTDPHHTTVTDTGAILGQPDPWRMLILGEADVDDDPAKEFLLSYWGPDATLQINLYETDETHEPRLLSSFNDPDLKYETSSAASTSHRATEHFDVQAGDFDGDGTDEVVAVGGRDFECERSQACWEVYVRIYDLDPETFEFVQRADTAIFTKDDNASRFMNGIAVAAGRYGPEFDEGIGVIFEHSTNNNDTDFYLMMSRVILAKDEDGGPLPRSMWGTASDPTHFAVGADGVERVHGTTGQRGFPINAAAVDFQQDGIDEFVGYARQLAVYEVDEQYRPVRIGSFGSSGPSGMQGRHLMTVADLDADNDLQNESSAWRPEIVVVQEYSVSDDGGISTDGELEVSVYSWDPEIGFPSLTETEVRLYRINPTGGRPLAMAALDAGDNGVRVGDPRRFSKTDIVRPLVILNAPPTHFDVFEGESFDVNHCYGEGEDCACREDLARCFQADYTTETERSITVETELTTDWSVAVGVDGGFDIPFGDELDIGVDIEIEATYGQGFRRRDQTTQTFTVQQSIGATRDDWIYAMIVNYDIWEYPLYVDGDLSGHIMIVTPQLQTRAWFDSKSWNAFDYIPYHEVGNILSYRSIASPDQNSALASAIRWDTGDQITLSSTSDVSWQLTSEGQTETEVENSVNMGINGSVDFDIPIPFIPNISVSGDYSTETVNTRNVRVSDKEGMMVRLGNVDQAIGNVRYSVIPYVYWAKNGALVLDYAVNPELAQPGFEGTWWQRRYGELSDPAFILPWRYDPEKGADVSEAQTTQTKEIIFNPTEPEVGDIIQIKARVRNWSLLPTPGPVEVRFFVGDPAAGGTPIVGTGGEESAFAPQLESRGSATVQMQWEVPGGIGFFPRIYAVIDPGDGIDEIHETNNKGWTVLNVASGDPTPIEDDASSEIPLAVELHQNYPNPFSGTTTIAFDLPRSEIVTVQVFDMLGREVSRLVDEELAPGSYNIHVDGADLTSGMYVYRMVAGEQVITKRMLVVR